MQATIAEAVNEISIEQKLEALKIISEQKDAIDKQISDLKMYALTKITGIQFLDPDRHPTLVNQLDFDLPEVPTKMVVKIIETYLTSRREELIGHAQELMK